MKSYFDAYGERAESIENNTQAAGRYAIQQGAEKAILFDLVKKLDICQEDNLLEIGCGTGNLLIPLSFLVNRSVGIDHQACVSKLMARIPLANLQCVGDDFLNLDILELGYFSKIVVYSVLHCLHDNASLYTFIDKSLSLLAPGGQLIFGDIPNFDLKQRFMTSLEGERFAMQWSQMMASSEIKEPDFGEVKSAIVFNDEKVIELVGYIRSKGFHAYVVPQNPDLPFGHTREDVVVRKVC